MLRLSPSGHKRLGQGSESFDVGPAGAELNVACSLALLGHNARYVTMLPNNNPLAEMLISRVKGYGVETQYICRSSGRLGLVFVETGASQRPSRVHYDRDHSSVSLASPDQYNWSAAFTSADYLHVTGITPALSKAAAEATFEAVQVAKKSGLGISCDLNFRSKLWQWDNSKSPQQLASHVMQKLLPQVNLLIANETDLGDVLGLFSDLPEGTIDLDVYSALARRAAQTFPNLSQVAITLRESLSASHNRWGGLLLDVTTDQVCFAPQKANAYTPYDIRHVVDRVGAGDAFAAGLLHALATKKHRSPDQAIAFATAASCLAHSVPGDINQANLSEIEALLAGSETGRVIR